MTGAIRVLFLIDVLIVGTLAYFSMAGFVYSTALGLVLLALGALGVGLDLCALQWYRWAFYARATLTVFAVAGLGPEVAPRIVLIVFQTPVLVACVLAMLYPAPPEE